MLKRVMVGTTVRMTDPQQQCLLLEEVGGFYQLFTSAESNLTLVILS